MENKITKESLESKIAELRKEFEENSENLLLKYDTMKTICFGEFYVSGTDGWKESFEINFQHITEEVRFSINPDQEYSDNFKWSMWSFRNMKATEAIEALEKSVKYISAVYQMLEILKQYTEIRATARRAKDFYFNEIIPLLKEEYRIENEIKKIQGQIKQIEKDSEIEEAKKIFVADSEWNFKRAFEINSRNDTYYIRIIESKGKLYFEVPALYDTKRKLTDELLLDLKKYISKPYLECIYDHEIHEYRYYKSSMVTTSENMKEEITKKEYYELRKKHYNC